MFLVRTILLLSAFVMLALGGFALSHVAFAQTPSTDLNALEIDSKFAPFMTQGQNPELYVERYEKESNYKHWFDTYFAGMTIRQAVGLELPTDYSTILTPNSKFAPFMTQGQNPHLYVARYEKESDYKQWFDTYFVGMTISQAVGLENIARTASTSASVVDPDSTTDLIVTPVNDDAPATDPTVEPIDESTPVTDPTSVDPTIDQNDRSAPVIDKEPSSSNSQSIIRATTDDLPIPVTDPARQKELIPQDITFEYVYDVDNANELDALVAKIISYTNDKVLSKERNEHSNTITYTTKLGSIKIFDSPFGTLLSYESSKLAIDNFGKFATEFVDHLGVIFDGTEKIPERPGNIFVATQQHDGLEFGMHSNTIYMDDSGGFSLHFDKWVNNIPAMNLIGLDEAIQNGRNYANQFSIFHNPKCEIHLDRFDRATKTSGHRLVMQEGRPIFQIDAGSCRNHHDAELTGNQFTVAVDGITGKVLYFSNLPHFWKPDYWDPNKKPVYIQSIVDFPPDIIDDGSPLLIRTPPIQRFFIPKDITFDSTFHAGLDDPDVLVEKITNYVGAKIVSKELNEQSRKLRYTLDSGYIQILYSSYTNGTLSYSAGEPYDSLSREDFIAGFFDALGIKLNAETDIPSSIFQSSSGSFRQDYEKITLDGHYLFISYHNNRPYIEIREWNNNLAEMNLISRDDAFQSGQDYAKSFSAYRGPECDLYLDRFAFDFERINLRMQEGRPIFYAHSGACKNDYGGDLKENRFIVAVDGLTGKALYFSHLPYFEGEYGQRIYIKTYDDYI